MISKRTTIIAVIVGVLLLAVAGHYSILLIPGTISWFITAVAGNSSCSKQVHTLWGMVAALFLFVQLPILVVILIVCEQAGDDTARNPPMLALIAMFVVYLASLVSYFGRGPKTRPNKSLQATATAPSVLTRP